MQKIPIVAIIGRTNVGKSTLFNRLTGIRQAITFDEPGTTRDRIFSEVRWGNKVFYLVDTAGFIHEFYGFNEAEIEKKAQDKIHQSIVEADLVLFVVDSKSGLLPEDEKLAKLIRSEGKNIILVINKVDDEQKTVAFHEFAELGITKVSTVSAISGKRSGDLLEMICNEITPPDFERKKSKILKLVIIGRPNVGKSTLFNAIAKSDVAIVSDIPGTTRDTQNLLVSIKNKDAATQFEIIDTAGLRRRGKIGYGLEKFSYLRTLESISRTDIVALVVDANEGITRGDAHLGQIALECNKRLIVVLNKIDLLKKKTKDEIKNLGRFSHLAKCTIVAISAKNKENIKLFENELAKIS